jgi:hypothetical protein
LISKHFAWLAFVCKLNSDKSTNPAGRERIQTERHIKIRLCTPATCSAGIYICENRDSM